MRGLSYDTLSGAFVEDVKNGEGCEEIGAAL
jgi:hypothetical protein